MSGSATASRRWVLVLDDSVAFGPGVVEERTFAGLLRKSRLIQQVYYSAVVGYETPNSYTHPYGI